MILAGGPESVSLAQNEHKNRYRLKDDALERRHPATYKPMTETAEIVARRYGVSREAQDRFAMCVGGGMGAAGPFEIA
jgi:acetyl-CoA C-acetyltransferase/acetyl-CoA acyltransferase